MIKPERLRRGDRVAVISLSSGIIGEPELIHRYFIAKRRLEEDYGLVVEPTPNALKGTEYIYSHPEKRAEDLMNAFHDPGIKAIFCAIGGDDSIRILRYTDSEVIRKNPKIFMGYSDTTITHFLLQKLGLVSFYGISVMCELSENVSMNPYTENAFRTMLFGDSRGFEVRSSRVWSKDYIEWSEENSQKPLGYIPETHGYEILSGKGGVRGKLIGGCIDVFMMASGTEIFPTPEECRGALLLIETRDRKSVV